jgi:hypothetical protein
MRRTRTWQRCAALVAGATLLLTATGCSGGSLEIVYYVFTSVLELLPSLTGAAA